MTHRMYAASLLWGAAQGLILHNWIAGWSPLLSLLILYFFRVPREEQMMLDQFGEAYQAAASFREDILIITADHGCDPTFKGRTEERDVAAAVTPKTSIRRFPPPFWRNGSLAYHRKAVVKRSIRLKEVGMLLNEDVDERRNRIVFPRSYRRKAGSTDSSMEEGMVG